MDKYEKLNQVREYISKIEEDIELSDNDDKQSLMNKNITECLKYISEILEESINENSVKTAQSGKRFFITEEQTYELTAKGNAKIGEIADELNRVTEINNTAKITTTWITDWLISVDILEINDLGQRVPTQSGNEMGINSKLMQISYNKVQAVNYYPLEAQKFIYDNIDNIISFHYNYKPQKTKAQPKNPFFITDEQRLQLNIVKNAKVSDIVNEFNKFTQENHTQKIQTSWITNWLVSIGIFERNDMNRGIPTKNGNEIGITRELIKKEDGSAYFQIWYSENAQKYIYDNISNIINFHNNKNQNMNNFQNIPYPNNMPIYKFIDENKEENIIIMSVGSCNTNTEKGSYKAVLIYQNNHKVLQGDIITRSANKCILYGIKDATEAIKKPSDIIIISPTLLGFGTRKSANYDICEEIINILTEKNCNIKIVTCEGMGFELRNYINLLSKDV